MQEKESIMAVRCELMPNSYPPDRIFNPHLTTIKDSYNLDLRITSLHSQF